IELGRRWGGLLRRGRRLGVGLFRLGLLGFVLRQRVGGGVGRGLGFLFFGLGLGGGGFLGPRGRPPAVWLPFFSPPLPLVLPPLSRSDPRPGSPLRPFRPGALPSRISARPCCRP